MMIMMLTMMKLRSTIVTITNLRLRRLMVTLMRLRLKLMITGGGGNDDNKGEGDIDNKCSKGAACFFEERGHLYTPLTMTMVVVMTMIRRMAKTIMMCQY